MDGPFIGVDGSDLRVEQSVFRRARCTLLRFSRDLVQHRARQIPPVRDHLGTDPLIHQVRIAAHHARPERTVPTGHVRKHRHPRHRLDTAGDHHVHLAGHHSGGREVDRLLAGTTLTVDAHPGDRLGQPGGQRGVARDVGALFADLTHAPPDDVVHVLRFDSHPRNQRVDDVRRQIHGVDTRQGTLLGFADTHGRSYRFDDHRIIHVIHRTPRRCALGRDHTQRCQEFLNLGRPQHRRGNEDQQDTAQSRYLNQGS